MSLISSYTSTPFHEYEPTYFMLVGQVISVSCMQCIDEIELDLKPDQAPILLGGSFQNQRIKFYKSQELFSQLHWRFYQFFNSLVCTNVASWYVHIHMCQSRLDVFQTLSYHLVLVLGLKLILFAWYELCKNLVLPWV